MKLQLLVAFAFPPVLHAETCLSRMQMSVHQLYERAESAIAQKDVHAAAVDLNAIVERDPREARAWTLLGRLCVFTRNYELAHEHFARAREAQGDTPLLLTSLALLYEVEGQPARAIATGERMVKLYPADAEAYVTRGRQLLKAHRAAEARKDFERALALQPNHRVARPLLLQTIVATESEAKAFRMANAALREDPQDWRSLMFKASQLLKRGKPEEAEPLIKSRLQTNSRCSYAHGLMAQVEVQNREPWSALNHLYLARKYGRPNLDHLRGLEVRAYLLLEDAANIMRVAEELAPGTHRAHARGVAALLLNQPERAVTELEQVEHKKSAILWPLATAYHLAGRQPERAAHALWKIHKVSWEGSPAALAGIVRMERGGLKVARPEWRPAIERERAKGTLAPWLDLGDEEYWRTVRFARAGAP